MAGHNKWSQIKRKKAVNDQKRGKIFTKIIREISVAARDGGGDPEFNPRLRLAVETAKSENMPQENIERAIKRGTGELEGVNYEELTYEGYGPGGVALFIETTTDNQNRTVAEVRHLLDKNGGNLGTDGSVAWQFDRRGQIYLDASTTSEEAVFEAALEAGAEDVAESAGEFVVTTDPTALHTVQEALSEAGFEIARAELAMIPKNQVQVAGSEAERLLKLLDALDDHDDVQSVSSNADISDDVLAEAMS
ncbi:MAG: YebC/PmpR family DNA-binding transcriptional regulator [Gemmatimonadales bacterium]|nr:MAG: YebC/PmpR family DNA-binding transcriptional regulator [Gemmatimonadales bacterium]